MSTPTQVLVIGAGPGGYAAALRSAALGRQVTLVERDAVGGTCLNVGCIPSKVLIHAAELANLPTSTVGTGVELTARVDLAQLQNHIQSVVTGLTGGVDQLLRAAGVTVIAGDARFSRPNRAVVASGDTVQHLEFDEAILATGSRPIEIGALPFSDDRVVDSTGALFSFTDIPERLAVVGGGYIGIELGTAWAKLGAKVTIIEAAKSILPGMDSRLARIVARRLTELGIEVLTDSTAVGLTDTETKDAGVVVTTPTGERTITASRVIVSVGRRPNTDELGLDVVGVSVDDRGLVPVDSARRAGRRILAIGDITSGPALAHKATAEAEVAARTAAGLDARFDPAAIPAIVFSDPEIATVGLTADEARAAGAEVQRFVFPLSASARFRTISDSDTAVTGQVELIADASGTILGAHLAGPHVSELIGELTLAIEMAVTAEELAATIHPHPTISEGLLEAAHGLLGMPLHVTAVRSAH